MNLEGNTILITGGGSGIGLGLALAFKQLGNEVIVAGRSAKRLEDAAAKGLKTLTADMTSAESTRALVKEATAKFPALNAAILNAGIMVNEKLTSRDNSATAEETIATNLLGPIRLTNALLPHLLKQKSAMLMTVTSGLAYMPLAMTPTYCATKAAVHSYTMSLRYQLKETAVDVKELIPPYVRTTLMGDRQAQDPHAMPLEEFIQEVMSILKANPKTEEIAVKNVLPMRTAGDQGPQKFREFFEQRNAMFLKSRQAEWDKL